MTDTRQYIVNTVIKGVFVVVPAYLAILLMLKGMQTVTNLTRPFAAFLPGGVPAQGLLSLLILLLVCFVVGAAVRTKAGRKIRERLEVVFFERLPGYGVLRSLTQRLVGDDSQTAWKPALAEIEDALTPAFIIEEHQDGRFTVFVPSIPTPFAGAVYILDPARVHLLDVPFTQAIQTVSRWGSGSKELVSAMQSQAHPQPSHARSA